MEESAIHAVLAHSVSPSTSATCVKPLQSPPHSSALVCVYVCVRERGRERVCESGRENVCVFVSPSTGASCVKPLQSPPHRCVYVCACACVCMCAWVRERERERECVCVFVAQK